RARVERDPKLVQAGVDQGGRLRARQADRVRVEEDVGASRHEMLDHARQIGIEERLADTVQQDALERGELIDDLSEAEPGQILGRLASSEGENAVLTLRVAAARRLH